MRKNHPTLLSCFLLLSIWGLGACTGTVPDAANSSDLPEVETEQPVETSDSPIEAEENELPAASRQTNSSEKPSRQVAQNSNATLKRVKVFFPKNPEAAEDFTAVRSVGRSTSSQGVASFAIAQLIAGPTSQEKQGGLIEALELSGDSNCGKNFTLSINRGVAKLQFCRDVLSAGIGDDARTRSSLEATLKQFSTVQSVVILDKNGDCLADLSGENRCLNVLPRG